MKHVISFYTYVKRSQVCIRLSYDVSKENKDVSPIYSHSGMNFKYNVGFRSETNVCCLKSNYPFNEYSNIYFLKINPLKAQKKG